MTQKLSVTIITLNEEKNVRTCIESVKSIADEVIVVDSGSKDKTQQIAEELGAKFIHNDWPGHQEQKNYAIDQTSNEWILSLDADEWIDERLAKEIKAVLEADGDGADGYQIDRETMFLGEFVKVWSPDWIFRLFKKSKGRFGGVNPHDVVIMKADSVCKKLKNPFFHNSYQTLEQYFSRMNAYTTIGSRALFKKGKRFSLHKLLLSPGWMFVRKFLFKQGFRDGYRGLLISISSAFYVFMKYAKLWSIQVCGEDDIENNISSEHASRS